MHSIVGYLCNYIEPCWAREEDDAVLRLDAHDDGY